jgi:hypothetical protein
MTKPDPTKDPEFQKVVQHLLNTPHQPHKPVGRKVKSKQKSAASSKPRSRNSKKKTKDAL